MRHSWKQSLVRYLVGIGADLDVVDLGPALPCDLDADLVVTESAGGSGDGPGPTTSGRSNRWSAVLY